MLAAGKRAGLTFREINELRARDLLALIDAYAGEKDNKPRMATKVDIDKFFAR